MNNYPFYFNEDKLENVKTYKMLSTSGTFDIAKQELKKIALKALLSLRKNMKEHFRTDITLTTKLFDALIKPILLYASEIWGVDYKQKNIDKDPLEQINIKFCKMLLGVSKSATSAACRAELGQMPL